MYIIDFIKSLGSVKRIGVIIWLILNAAIVTYVIGFLLSAAELGLPDWACLLIGFLAYLLSVVVALSPVGEFILRWRQKCRTIKDPQIINRLDPIFNRVFSRAIQLTPNLNRNIKLYICDEDAPNAFATGRNTICVTQGLLCLSDDEIEAVLAHEFGHLAHKDTDIILVVAVGNLIVTVFFVVLQIIVSIFSFLMTLIIGIASGEKIAAFLSAIPGILTRVLISVFMWLWTRLGILLCMISNRGDEYDADEYAFNLGCGNTLCSALSKLGGSDARGLWAALNSSHPATYKRIERLQQLGGGAGYYGQV